MITSRTRVVTSLLVYRVRQTSKPWEVILIDAAKSTSLSLTISPPDRSTVFQFGIGRGLGRFVYDPDVPANVFFPVHRRTLLWMVAA
jgi:hypothetical protein